MAKEEIERYERLAALTTRLARAAAELEAARGQAELLSEERLAELDELTDRLQALHLLLANEVERAWNAAEADARRARRAEMMGRVHDAVSADTTLPDEGRRDIWQTLGPQGPEGPPREGLSSSDEPR
jgi:hypothetical protein